MKIVSGRHLRLIPALVVVCLPLVLLAQAPPKPAAGMSEAVKVAMIVASGPFLLGLANLGLVIWGNRKQKELTLRVDGRLSALLEAKDREIELVGETERLKGMKQGAADGTQAERAVGERVAAAKRQESCP